MNRAYRGFPSVPICSPGQSSGVIGPLGAAGNTDSVRSEEIQRGFDIVGIARLVQCIAIDRWGTGSILQQHKRAQRPAGGKTGGALAHVIAVTCGVLYLLAQIAEDGPGEHVGTLGNPRYARFIDKRCGSFYPFAALEWVGAIPVLSIAVFVFLLLLLLLSALFVWRRSCSVHSSM